MPVFVLILVHLKIAMSLMKNLRMKQQDIFLLSYSHHHPGTPIFTTTQLTVISGVLINTLSLLTRVFQNLKFLCYT